MDGIGGHELAGKEKAPKDRGGGGDDGSSSSSSSVADVGGNGGSIAKEGRIQVSVRLRPLNAKELERNDQPDWECINDTTIIFRNSLPERSLFPTAFTFDRVFRCDSTTERVYEEGAKQVALSVVSGINASIFAYGQTSSGKTYTMTGITEYAVTDIYEYIQRHKEREFILKFSAMEIYNEAVRDLLSADSTPLRLLDDPDRGTTVEKLTEETLKDWGHMKELLAICEAQRQIGETSLNETSSRSHQILRLSVESSAREFLGKDNSSSLAASVNFVDLAGSERASQALSAGTRLKEGCHINRSLLTLGTVVRKLSKGRNGHIPYRDSKLTRILQPSLGGNARTAIICTMSPARSHVEQSRNTLFFASCAKEVATSAHVNVVMSDKALVKHLQKELTRLESELRNPGLASSKSYAEALLKEKDSQIKKLEKEIKELIHQRDLAQSQLEDLPKSVGDDQELQQWDGFVHSPTSHELNNCEHGLLSLYDSSSALDFRFVKSNESHQSTHGRANCNDIYLEIFGNSNEPDATSTQNSMSRTSSIVLSPHKGGEIITHADCVDTEDLCKEVRCIETDETGTSISEQSYSVLTEVSDDLLPMTTWENELGGKEQLTKPKEDKELDVRKAIDNFEKSCPTDSSQCPSVRALSSSRCLGLTKSRSCKASLMNNSISPWLPEEQNVITTSSNFLIDFHGSPEGFHRRLSLLNYSAKAESLSEDGSQTSGRTSNDVITEPGNIKIDTEEDTISICTFVAELTETAQTQLQKQLSDGQVVDDKNNDGTKIVKSVSDIGLDMMINSTESPHWLAEFERQQQEIIKLWHACNVSLVHRTYFFLLFKGDPSDSIYMEVELRRLSFLRRLFTQGNLDKSMVDSGCSITLASSMRTLRREREMLCRQIQKRLTAEERESLYRKWGIPLQSKQRRIRLTRLLWSDTTNMDHIRESASVVATLVGLLEPDQALKEMFGLSFTPQRISRRSQSWKHGMSSLM